MAQVRIRDREELVEWLEGRSREVVVAIASRAAMRALPALEKWLAEDEEKAVVGVFPVFRALAVSQLAASDSALNAEMGQVIDRAINSMFFHAASFPDIFDLESSILSAFSSLLAIHDAVLVTEQAADVVIDTTRLVTDAAWGAVESDANFLTQREDQSISDFLCEPLWPDGMPEELRQLWNSMKKRLLAREGEHWEVWTNWYDARLDPSRSIPCYSPPIPELERKRVLLPEEVWKAGPAKANAEIKRLIEEYGCAAERETEDDDVVDERPVIPEQETATIEVEWSEDRLVPKKRPVEADASTLATLQALGQQLQDLTSALRQDSSANAIDPRVVEELEKVARLVPAATPMDESQLIQLAMQVDEVRAYFEGMTEDERLAWPEILRRKLETQLGVLHAFLDQYRTWEKVHGQDGQELSDEEVQAVPDMAEEVAHDLEELGEERVDPQISRVLRDLKARLAEALQMVQRLGHVARERAADLWESINNIAKAIGGWLVRKTKVFGKTLDKEIDEELKILARQLAKWGRRIIFPGGGGWVAYKFGWLQSVIEWLKTVLPSSFM